ncbi:class I SAM-dependent methyltransferase [Gammaproteobacteria bacterium]|nr:class I SAM-dependent methyltransferase [Gammaproteobacteria bacterium]
MSKSVYELKNDNYYRNSRKDLIDKVDIKNDGKVLDVGCGTGVNLGYVKGKYPSCFTVGIEPYADVSEEYSIDRLHHCSAEKFLDIQTDKDFDVVMCLDSLEHMWDYQTILAKLADIVKDDGVLLISVPNISNFRTFYNVFIQKDFPKSKDGIFDETHCRWFTKKVLKADLLHIGFGNIEFSYTGLEKGKFLYYLDLITFGSLRDYIGFQIVAVARRLAC